MAVELSTGPGGERSAAEVSGDPMGSGDDLAGRTLDAGVGSEAEVSGEGTRHGLINWTQCGVLADRYLEIMLADFGGTLLLLLQAPFLAALVVLVWSNLEQPTRTLYFVMILSCLWIGCMDASREIVKERALYLRERMVNLEVGAYLLSKVRVLVVLNTVQVATYVGIIVYYLDVRIHTAWVAIGLWLATLTGTCLGLLISSSVRRSDHAVALVPLAILPQIMFSEFAIGKEHFAGASRVIYALMPSRWGFEALENLARTSTDYWKALGAMALLPLFGVGFLVLAYPLLRLKKY